MTITDFLLARIAEDEAVARAADVSRWRGEDKGITFDVYSDKFDDGEAMARLEADTRANQDHIVNWSPPRVLAECAAKRAIVEAHREIPVPDYGSAEYCCESCSSDGEYPNGWPCMTVAALAAVYSDHPDYDEAWRA